MWKDVWNFFFGWMGRPEIVSRMPWGQIATDLLVFAAEIAALYYVGKWLFGKRRTKRRG